MERYRRGPLSFSERFVRVESLHKLSRVYGLRTLGLLYLKLVRQHPSLAQNRYTSLVERVGSEIT
jgi:hypothetical protein